MSYRPENQSLGKPAQKLIEGIDEFNCAVEERHNCGEWKDSHLDHIAKISERLLALKFELIKINNDHW